MKDWIEIASAQALRDGDVVGVTAGGRDLALYRVGDEVFVSDNLCSHGNASLCDGYLEGHEIECPLHQGKFDIRSGEPLCTPLTKAIRVYPAKIHDGRVMVELTQE